MKVAFITDAKPSSCKECMFYGETIQPREDVNNILDIADGCIMNLKDYEHCILFEDKEYIDNLTQNPDITLVEE